MPENKNDLGFGARLSQAGKRRMMNRDGTFNVDRNGISVIKSMHIYHWLITLSWTKFLAIVSLFYIAINFLFAFGYYCAGSDALNGEGSNPLINHFWNCFFFSVQTFATIGYGALNPRNYLANWLVTIEASCGLFCVAMSTGLLFARFSRPSAKILYSDNAVIAPYKDGKALMVQVINHQSNQLINLEARVIFSMMEENNNGTVVRQYTTLVLEREKVTFFPLHWRIVHVINEKSPLHDKNHDYLEKAEAEMFVLITAIDETYSQTVHSRSSYRFDEIIWGAKFKDIFEKSSSGKATKVSLKRIHEFENAELP